MRRLLAVAVDCGELVCFSREREELCPMVRTSGFGTRWHCGLFPDLAADGSAKPLVESHALGYLLRTRRCMEAERAGALLAREEPAEREG